MFENAKPPTLIVNSTYDNQTFASDIEMRSALFAHSENVAIHIYDDISHFGYKIDTENPASIYRKAVFPDELIAEFSAFCRWFSL